MIGMKVIGAQKLAKAFVKEVKRYAGSPTCELGVGTNYAIYVHENLKARHDPPTEAKFLERAVDRIRPRYLKTLQKLVKDNANHKTPLSAALYQLGLLVDADYVPRVPVEFGRLRNSHYVAPPAGLVPGGTPTTPGK